MTEVENTTTGSGAVAPEPVPTVDTVVHPRANTSRAYTTDWRTWVAWCHDQGVSEWSLDEDLLAAYATWCRNDRGYAASTTARKLSGVVAGLRQRHGADGVSRHLAEEARKTLATTSVSDAAATTSGGRRQPAAAVSLDRFTAMLGTCGQDPAGVRDRALLLVTVAVGGRSAEIAGLTIDDITDAGDQGLVVNVRATRASAVRDVEVSRAATPLLDPVAAWRDWREMAGHRPGDPAFLRILRGGRIKQGVGLSPEAISDIVQRRGTAAGIAGATTADSLRAAMATWSPQTGHRVESITAHGGWTSRSAPCPPS